MTNTAGRPKNAENMTAEERQEYNNRMREKGIGNLSLEQKIALTHAMQAMGEFLEQWTQSFDLYDPETPRRIQHAYHKLGWAFERETD